MRLEITYCTSLSSYPYIHYLHPDPLCSSSPSNLQLWSEYHDIRKLSWSKTHVHYIRSPLPFAISFHRHLFHRQHSSMGLLEEYSRADCPHQRQQEVDFPSSLMLMATAPQTRKSPIFFFSLSCSWTPLDSALLSKGLRTTF